MTQQTKGDIMIQQIAKEETCKVCGKVFTSTEYIPKTCEEDP